MTIPTANYLMNTTCHAALLTSIHTEDVTGGLSQSCEGIVDKHTKKMKNYGQDECKNKITNRQIKNGHSYLVRHDSWSFVSFKPKKNIDEEYRPRSMSLSHSTDQLKQSEPNPCSVSLLPLSNYPNNETSKHHSLLEMSLVSKQADTGWLPFSSMDNIGESVQGGMNRESRGGGGASERDRKLWSRDGEGETQRLTTREIVNQLEKEIKSRDKDIR